MSHSLLISAQRIRGWRPSTYALDDRFRWSKRNNQYIGIEEYNRGSAVGASWSRRVLRLLACLLAYSGNIHHPLINTHVYKYVRVVWFESLAILIKITLNVQLQ